MYLLALLAVPAARCACLPAPVRACVCVCVGVWPCSLRSLSLLLALLAVAVVPPADCLRPPACAAVPVCACRYLVNGGLFSPPSPRGLSCLPAFRVRVGACGRVCGRVRGLPACVCLRACAWALSPHSADRRVFYSPIMAHFIRLYGSFSRSARRVVRSAHSAANFFEIVFKPSISVQLSSAGMGGAA